MTNQKQLRVLLTHLQWSELRVDDHKEFVRAAFYLGLPYEYIFTRVSSKGFAEERESVVESAKELGFCENDNVYKVRKGP